MRDALVHELKTAIGRLRARRAYSWLALGMLALAIASNVAVFTVLSRTLLRPFPFNEDRMVIVFATFRDVKGELQELPTGSSDFVHWQKGATSLEGLEIARMFAGSITDRGETEAVKVVSVSGGIFRLLGVRPFIGSDFASSDDRREGNAVMLAYPFWKRHFGGKPGAVGRSIVIDGSPRMIRGVMPEGFEIPNAKADVFVPAGFSVTNMPNPGNRGYTAFARLKPGVTPESATAELQGISADLGKRNPAAHKDYGALARPLRDALYAKRRSALITLFVAVLLVHLLACANVANLMLAQVSDQSTVTAVRLAVGAPPGQIVRYRLMEGFLISIGAAIAGALLGTFAVRAILNAYADPQLLAAPDRAGISIFAFVVALTLLTALAITFIPALREAKVPISALLNAGTQRSSSTIERRRARELFIVAEVALAIPLLIAATVAVQRFRELQSVDIGFKPDRIMTGQLIMPARYDEAGRAKFAAELVRRLESSPGIASAAVTTSNFRVNGGASNVVRSETMSEFVSVAFRRITPGFFETMQSPLVAGRPFQDGDVAESPAVAIVSESFARQFWPGQNPLGKKLFRQNPKAKTLTVVGVAREIRDVGVAEDIGPTLYTSYLQGNFIYLSLLVRADGDPATVKETMKNVVQSIDGNLAPDEMIPFAQLVDETLGAYKLQVTLLSGFAIIALILAVVGVFAVTEYSVSRRLPEAGTRMAFGASPAAVVREFVGAALRPIVIGVVAGVLLILAAMRTPFVTNATLRVDAAQALGVIAVLTIAAVIASFIPALRARSARPSELLRSAR